MCVCCCFPIQVCARRESLLCLTKQTIVHPCRTIHIQVAPQQFNLIPTRRLEQNTGKNTTNCNSRSVLYPTQAYTCRQCYCSAHIINQCQKKDNVLHSIHVQEITYNYTVSSQVSSTVCKCSGSLWLTELCEHPVDRHTLAPPRHDTHAHTRTPMTLTLGGEALANIGTAH